MSPILRAHVPRLLTALLIGCVSDKVLPNEPDEAVCGDGIVASTEDCDGESPGCSNCHVVPGWQCINNDCTPLCGDGILGDGPTCQNARKAEACDMTGYWVTRETSFARDLVLNEIQTSSSWFVYRFSQQGEAFQVEQALNCGTRTTGSATVEPTAASLRALLYSSGLGPNTLRGPRRGTFKPDGTGCAVTFDRWYNGRGILDTLLPADFDVRPDLASLPAMPYEPNPANPQVTNAALYAAGADDAEHDGIPGMAFRITGIASGVRNSAQRDFKEWATLAGQPVPRFTILMTVPGTWDLQESVLRVTDCGLSCGLVSSRASVAKDHPPRIVFRFLGKSLSGPAVSAVVKGNMGDAVDADLATCGNVRNALPHDSSKQ